MPDVICLGILVADLVARPVDQFPERGRLLLSDEMKLSAGGCAANTAAGLARMGPDRCGAGADGVSREPWP